MRTSRGASAPHLLPVSFFFSPEVLLSTSFMHLHEENGTTNRLRIL